MKRIIVLVALVALVLAGCNFPGKTAKNPESVKPQDTQKNEVKKQVKKQAEETKKTPVKGQYYVGLSAPVSNLTKWVSRYERFEGVYLQKQGDYRTVLITMGEKMTGGYEVKVTKVIQKADKWVIEAAFSDPREGEATSEALNSPREVVSIFDDGKPIEVIPTEGQSITGTVVVGKPMEIVKIPEGKQLPVSKNFIVFAPLENEKISNPVRIKGKARAFEATFIVHMEDGHNVLYEKAVQTTMGAPEWGKFDVELKYQNPTNPVGAVIFSIENMNDGSKNEELAVPVKF